MKSKYPHFSATHVGQSSVTFVGDLHVMPELPVYRVSIEYRGDNQPRVKVLSPTILPIAPHTYNGGETLCLYHPSYFHWDCQKLIARHILRWTAVWIYFYEVWLQHPELGWLGPEVPHHIPKPLFQ